MTNPTKIRDMLIAVDKIIGFVNPTVKSDLFINTTVELGFLAGGPRFSFSNDGDEVIDNMTEKELLVFLEGIIYGAETCSSIT